MVAFLPFLVLARHFGKNICGSNEHTSQHSKFNNKSLIEKRLLCCTLNFITASRLPRRQWPSQHSWPFLLCGVTKILYPRCCYPIFVRQWIDLNKYLKWDDYRSLSQMGSWNKYPSNSSCPTLFSRSYQ